MTPPLGGRTQGINIKINWLIYYVLNLQEKLPIIDHINDTYLGYYKEYHVYS